MAYQRRLPQRRTDFLVCGVAAAVFLLLLGCRDIVTSHEARVAETARTMANSGWPWRAASIEVPRTRLASGRAGGRLVADMQAAPLRVNPWIVPVLLDQVRLQKPPLPYWATAVLFRLFGTSESAARAVPAVMGFVGLFLVYDLSRLVLGRPIARLAALSWISTYFVVTEYRKAMADPYLAFFALFCLWAWVTASAPGRPEPSPVRGDRRAGARIALAAFYASLALGALSKGPVILVHVLVPVVALHACSRRRPPGGWASHLAGAAIFAAIAIPWPASVRRSVPDVVELWRYESVGEAADNVRNARPPWYYLPQLPYVALPWTPALIAGLYLAARRGRSRGRFALVWYITTVALFSLVHVKKNAYLLPLMPAQSILIAQGVNAAIVAARRWRSPAALRLFALHAATGGAGAAVLSWLFIRSLAWPSGPLLAFVALGAGVVPLLLGGRLRRHGTPLRQAASFVVLLFLLINLLEPRRHNRRSAKPLCAQLSSVLSSPNASMWTANLPVELRFYLPQTARYDLRATTLYVVSDADNPTDVRRLSERLAADSLRRLPLDPGAASPRWELYQLTIKPSGLR